MTISEEFSQVLHDWTEAFMHRSMHDFIKLRKESGLSMPQIRALFHLHHGSKCGVSDVAELLEVTNAAASQMIDRLVLKGYIERSEDPVDRRAKQLRLTAKGHSLVSESIEIRRRWMEKLTDALTIDEQKSIINALTILTHTARDLEQGDNQVEKIHKIDHLAKTAPESN